MTQTSVGSKMHLAIIIEENEQGFHRESLWFGATPGNLGLMIMDVMKEWYEPNKDSLDESIIKYHNMLEDKDNLTFEMMAGEGFNADGMRIEIRLSNDINEMFNFVINEICSIFAENGETPESFASLAEFRQHFADNYEVDEDLLKVMEGVNEITISKALYLIDMKYDYMNRHFTNGMN